MLRKLMKHELRASSHIMLPLFGIVILLSLGVSVMLRLNFGGDNPVLNIFFGIISVAYGISLCAVFIVVLVLMINRFRTNLLGDEGYVMFTLPVSVHQLIWSKIIISLLWFMASCVVVGLSALVLAADGNFFQATIDFLKEAFYYLDAYYAFHSVLFLIEGALLIFFGYALGCLQFYASMAFGYGFSRHRVLYSLGFFFGTQFLLQTIGSLIMVSNGFSNLMNSIFGTYSMEGVSGVHLALCVTLLITLLIGAVFYFCTTHFLQKRLNIE